MNPELESLFKTARCEGALCVRSLSDGSEVALSADIPVVAASVFKVGVALEAETQFATGRLDPTERVALPAVGRTPGPTGFSLFRDDAEASLRDLVAAMLTISDNHATDVLLHRVGIDAVNENARRLGLADTVIVSDLATVIESLAHEAGFESWDELSAWSAQAHSPDETATFERLLLDCRAFDPRQTNRTTPRDMAALLAQIVNDEAGPPPACARVRQLMARQLTRHRLATGFAMPTQVAAKSGGLLGLIRNEVGIIELQDGSTYTAAAFCTAQPPATDTAAIDRAIGAAAAAGVAQLRGQAA
jgi:beta-lactamase class A